MSAKELRRIWKDEFLPSIRREIKTKILELKSSIKALTERGNAIEKSQDFVSKKYDTAIAALQSVKSQTANLDKKYTTITNSLEEKLGELAGTMDKQDQSLYRVECALDEIACEQALLFGQAKRASRERASEGPAMPLACAFSLRLVSLSHGQMGELAWRLLTKLNSI